MPDEVQHEMFTHGSTNQFERLRAKTYQASLMFIGGLLNIHLLLENYFFVLCNWIIFTDKIEFLGCQFNGHFLVLE